MAKATSQSDGNGFLGTPNAGDDKSRSPISPQGFIEEIDYNEISFMEVVGSGAFGVVKRAKWRNQVVAVKTIQDQADIFRAEVQQLSSVDHPNIIKLYGICNKKPKVCLVMEYAEGGSLYTVIHPNEGDHAVVEYRFSHVIHWALQCAHAVKYLHGMKPKAIIHRDLKPPNMLLTNHGSVLKICDFGTACYIHSNMTSTQGSAAWMAPEVFEGTSYSEKCDVYSFGIVLWEMITRYKPYQELYHHPYRVMWAVHEGIRPPDVRTIPKSLQNLIKSCWNHDMNQRPPFVEIVEYFERAKKYVPDDDCFLDVQAASVDSGGSQSSYYTDESSHQFTSSAVRTSIPLEERSGGKSSTGSNDITILPPVEPIIPPEQKTEFEIEYNRPEIGRASSCGYPMPSSTPSNLETPSIDSGHRRSRSWCDASPNPRKLSDNPLNQLPGTSYDSPMSHFGVVSFPPNTPAINSGAVKQSYTTQSQTVTDSYPPTSYVPTGYSGMIDAVHLVGPSHMHQTPQYPHQHWPGSSQRFPLLGTSSTNPDNSPTQHQAEYNPDNHFTAPSQGALDIPQTNPNPPPYVSPSTYQQQQHLLSKQQHLAEQFYHAHSSSPHGRQTPPISHLSQEFNQLDLRTPTVDIETMQNDLANRYQTTSSMPSKAITLPSSFRNSGHASNSSSGRSTPISVSPPRDGNIKIDRSKSHSPKVHFSRAESQPSIPAVQREIAFKRYQSDMDRSDFWKLLPNELMPATPIADNNESMIIYKQHLDMVDKFFKLQSEMDYLIQRKLDVEKQLQDEEREQRRSSQHLENFLKAQEEHEEVLVLHASVKAQLDKVKQKRNLQRF